MESDKFIRQPAVAGMFYPENPNALKGKITELQESERGRVRTDLATQRIIGGVVPHAGYIYSGFEAIHFFELIRLSEKEFDTIVILNPDHQGYSPSFATSPHDEWETPLGCMQIDKDLAAYFPQSEIAHRNEHAAEVMLPFIQTILGSQVKILPITIGSPTPETARKIALKLLEAAKETDRKLLVIASSDFSHYVTPEEGIKLDNLVIERIEMLDSDGVYQAVRKFGITVCGYGPIMTLIEYSLLCTKKVKVDIAARGNSGKHSPSKSVVDYVTIIFSA